MQSAMAAAAGPVLRCSLLQRRPLRCGPGMGTARLRSLPAPQAPATPLGAASGRSAPRVGACTRPSRTGSGRRRSSRHLCLSDRSAASARRGSFPPAVQHAGGAGGHQQARHRPHHPRGPCGGVRGEPHLCGANGRAGQVQRGAHHPGERA